MALYATVIQKLAFRLGTSKVTPYTIRAGTAANSTERNRPELNSVPSMAVVMCSSNSGIAVAAKRYSSR